MWELDIPHDGDSDFRIKLSHSSPDALVLDAVLFQIMEWWDLCPFPFVSQWPFSMHLIDLHQEVCFLYGVRVAMW